MTLKYGYGHLKGSHLKAISGTVFSSNPNGYSLKKTIVIDHTKVSTVGSTNLTNFPVLIFGTYAYLATVANAGSVNNTATLNSQTVPADLIFTSDAAGSVLLNWEVASYTATTGAIEVWVQVPAVSASVNTTIYMWVGKSSVTTYQCTASSTWDANFLIVQHFANGSALSLIDSTINGHNGTATGAVSAGTGQIDGSAAFSGTSQYINNGNAAFLTPFAHTVEAWVKPTDYVNYNGVVSKTNGAVAQPFDMYITQTTGKASYFIGNGASLSSHADSAGAISTSAWTHLAGSFDGNSAQMIYVNGSQNGTGTPAGINDATHNIFVGTRTDLVTMMKGGIDEVRVSNVARSADWLITGYNNQNSPSTFSTIS